MADLIEIKLKISIDQLAIQLGIQFASDSMRYSKAVCPFHNDINPSFVVDKISQLARCYSAACVAHKPMDHVGLIRLVRHQSEDEAVDTLYELAGEPRPADTMHDYLRRVMQRLHANIAMDVPAEFFSGRGVNAEALKDLVIGYSPSYASFQECLADIPMDIAVKLELVQPHLFNNSIIYPQFDGKGRMAGFRSRPFASAQKYYSTSRDFPLQHSRLYGLHLVQGSMIILVEGPNDVLALRSAGVKNVVGLNGNRTKDTERYLEERGFSDVVFLADGEEAGKAAMMGAPAMVRVNQIPEGLDPDEFIQKYGIVDFARLINQAKFPFQIMLQSRLKNIPEGIEGKIVLIKSIANDISEGLPRIVLLKMQDELAEILGIPRDDVGLIFEMVDYDTVGIENKIISHMALGGVLSEDIKMKVLPWMLSDQRRRNQFIDLKNGLSLSEHVTDRGMLTLGDVEKFLDMAKRRRLKTVLSRTASSVLNMSVPVDEIVGKAMREAYDVSYEGLHVITAQQQIEIGVRNAIDRYNNQDRLLGLSLGNGFPKINEILQGLRPNAYYVLAATQGTGKSALALEWAMAMSHTNRVPVLWISFEMSELSISTRIISKLSKISAKRIMSGKLKPDEVTRLATMHMDHATAPFYIVSTNGLSVSQIVALVRKMKTLYGIQAVFVDYIQLIAGASSVGASSYERVGTISTDLKNGICMNPEIGLPLVAIAQLHRQAVKQAVPIAENIAESYKIAQDADAIITIKRRSPEEMEADKKVPGQDYGNILMNIDKNRDGEDKQLIGLMFYKTHLTLCEVGSSTQMEIESAARGVIV